MNSKHELQTVLFDLDGTLVDHFEVLHRCYVHTIRALGKKEPTYDEVRRAVGGSMERTMRTFVTEAEFDAAAEIFWEVFDRTCLDKVMIFPGGSELLAALASEGRAVAVYTNKQGKASRAICDHVGFGKHLKAVFGAGDTPWYKPQAEFTRHVLGELCARAESTCLIGDSPYDIATAQNGGIRCYCVTTGTHGAGELRAAGADGVFPGLAPLAEAVFGLRLDMGDAPQPRREQ